MYLARLSVEKRYLFRDLEIIMSKIDGDFSPNEKLIIDTHCVEMHIDNNNYESDFSEDELLKKIEGGLNENEQRIFFFELAATVLADDVYHESEKKLINKLSNVLKIDNDKVDDAFDIINDLKSVYARCESYIN